MAITAIYAEGFLEYARDTIGFEKGLEELKDVKSVFRDNPEFFSFLENPAIAYAEKCGTIETVLARAFSQNIRGFLKLLLKKGRMNIFANIAEYARIKYSHGKEIDAVINFSYPLSMREVQDIKDSLEKKLNKKLHLYLDMEPELLGGIRVNVGNIVIDGSVKKRLEDLKEKLAEARVN